MNRQQRRAAKRPSCKFSELPLNAQRVLDALLLALPQYDTCTAALGYSDQEYLDSMHGLIELGAIRLKTDGDEYWLDVLAVPVRAYDA